MVTSRGLANADQEQILGNVWDFRSMVKMTDKSVGKKPHGNVSKRCGKCQTVPVVFVDGVNGLNWKEKGNANIIL